jgi:hypothetical protein
MAGRGATVGRPAFFLGLALGIAIAIAGFFCLPLLGLPDWAESFAELACVAIALGTTSGVWKLSVARSGLDTPASDRDGEKMRATER